MCQSSHISASESSVLLAANIMLHTANSIFCTQWTETYEEQNDRQFRLVSNRNNSSDLERDNLRLPQHLVGQLAKYK